MSRKSIAAVIVIIVVCVCAAAAIYILSLTSAPPAQPPSGPLLGANAQ